MNQKWSRFERAYELSASVTAAERPINSCWGGNRKELLISSPEQLFSGYLTAVA
jgi:hypothetical protein